MRLIPYLLGRCGVEAPGPNTFHKTLLHQLLQHRKLLQRLELCLQYM